MKLKNKHLETEIQKNKHRLELYYQAIKETKELIRILNILKNKINEHNSNK